jgi:hypothetical protein
MRKGFNFYRSYFEVAMELKDAEFIAFIKALLQRQFNGIEPTDLKGMAKFAYLSQKFSIDSQVLGFETKTKEKLTPTEGGSIGAIEGASVQEKGKEKEKEKVQLSKILFTDCNLFDKNIFKSEFSDWGKDKLIYYYEAALAYSNEGNKYIDWKATINNWARRDKLAGKIKFDSINEPKSKEQINKEKLDYCKSQGFQL